MIRRVRENFWVIWAGVFVLGVGVWVDSYFERGEVSWISVKRGDPVRQWAYGVGTARGVVIVERDYLDGPGAGNGKAGLSYETSDHPVALDAVSWAGNRVSLHVAGMKIRYFVSPWKYSNHTNASVVLPCWLCLLAVVPAVRGWRRRNRNGVKEFDVGVVADGESDADLDEGESAKGL